MSDVHMTTDGDMMDDIAKEYLGTEAEVVRLYESNPGLASLGPRLPAGIFVFIPDPRPVNRSVKGIRLWG